ncbi:aldolase [Acidisoma sp. 7E03]
MAHELTARTAAGANSLGEVDATALREARVDLAAALRMAARLGLEEGICNHFSAMVPGRDDLFLVNPYGLAFREVTASSLLVCDFHGNVLEGEGAPEATAFYIHARLHRQCPRARVAFHTHMPYATALSMVEGEPFVWAGQTALKFYGRTAIDDAYNGLALDEREGDRIAASLGAADILFLRNHGVMVTAPNIAEAWDDLYYLERAAEVQVKAHSIGRRLMPVPAEIAARTAAQIRAGDAESARLHLESVKRLLMKVEPEFAT